MRYKIDQITLFVEDAEKKKKELNKTFGANEWVEDDAVHSHITFFDAEGNERVTCENVVKSKLNHELMGGGIGFELLEMTEGFSYHQHRQAPGILHFAAHVDDLDEAIEYFEGLGYNKVQYARTMSHEGTDRKYQYIFMDTRPLLGFYLKLIKN